VIHSYSSLDALVYGKSQPNRFGVDIAIDGDWDLNESEMSVWIPFADGNRRDGVGDRLEIGGIDLSRHRMNPVVLFDHGKKCELPIAISEDPETKRHTVELDVVNQKAKGKAFFYQGKGARALGNIMGSGSQGIDHATFCEQLFHMMAQKYVRGGSIGYQVIQAEPIYADPMHGIPQGMHLRRVLMLEYSVVVIPANMDTVQKVMCDGVMCGKALSPILVKSLSPYMPQRKVQMGWEKKAMADDHKFGWEGEQKKPAKETRAAKLQRLTAEAIRLRRGYEENSVNPNMDRTKTSRKADRAGSDYVKEARKQGLSNEEIIDRFYPPVDDTPQTKKSINSYRRKSVDAQQQAPIEEQDEQMPDEPLSASILKRISEDFSILLQDYDEMLSLCEQEDVNTFLMDLMHGLDAELSNAQTLYSKIHMGMQPIVDGLGEDGQEEPDGDEYYEEDPNAEYEEDPNAEYEEDPSDQYEEVDVEEGDPEQNIDDAGEYEEEEDNEPSGEEAYEGMRRGRKNLDLIRKSLRGSEKVMKRSPMAEFDPDSAAPKFTEPGDEENVANVNYEGNENQFKGKPAQPDDSFPDQGAEHSEDAAPTQATGEVDSPDEGRKDQEKTLDGALQMHEHEHVRGAQDLLTKLSSAKSLTDEDKMSAYHHHKLLSDISIGKSLVQSMIGTKGMDDMDEDGGDDMGGEE
jgi:hypothetical protein